MSGKYGAGNGTQLWTQSLTFRNDDVLLCHQFLVGLGK